VLMVTGLDRLARSTRDLLNIIGSDHRQASSVSVAARVKPHAALPGNRRSRSCTPLIIRG
jgi:hypothetical protein